MQGSTGASTGGMMLKPSVAPSLHHSIGDLLGRAGERQTASGAGQARAVALAAHQVPDRLRAAIAGACQ